MLNFLERLSFGVGRQFDFVDGLLSIQGPGGSMSDRQAVETLQEMYSDQHGDDCPEVKVCSSMLTALGSGAQIHTAMIGNFSPSIVCVFATTKNQSGDAARSGFSRLMGDMKSQSVIKRGLYFTMVKAAFFISAGVGFSIGIKGMVDIFKDIMSPEDYNDVASTVWYMVASALPIAYPIFVLLISGAFAGLKYLMPRWTGGDREEMSGIPVVSIPFNIYRSFRAMQFFSVLSLMVDSGTKMKDALKKINEWQEPYMRWHIALMLRGLAGGGMNLSNLDTGLLAPRLAVRLRIAGKGGVQSQLQAFKDVGRVANDDYAQYIKSLASTINFAGILVCVAITAWSATVGLGAIFGAIKNL